MTEINVGNRIKELRIEMNLKPKDLAEKTNLDPSQIYKIESGRAKPSLDALVRICNSLGVSLSEFFSNTEVKLSAEQRELLENSKFLTEDQINLLNKFLLSFKSNS